MKRLSCFIVGILFLSTGIFDLSARSTQRKKRPVRKVLRNKKKRRLSDHFSKTTRTNLDTGVVQEVGTATTGNEGDFVAKQVVDDNALDVSPAGQDIAGETPEIDLVGDGIEEVPLDLSPDSEEKKIGPALITPAGDAADPTEVQKDVASLEKASRKMFVPDRSFASSDFAEDEDEQEYAEEREERLPETQTGEWRAFDVKKKKQEVVDMVDMGVAYLMENTPDQAFSAFTHNKDFIKGELYLFVYDLDGVCLAHGHEADLLWRNLIDFKDDYGIPVIKNIIKEANEAGNWITYQWRHSTKISYVKRIKKDGMQFIIGCGYYPHSKVDAVVNLVKGGVAHFNEVVKAGKLVEEAFSTISYPGGRFILGDLYLYALDFQGVHYAHGDLPGLIGTNGWDYKDSTGKYVNREIIEKLGRTDEGIFIEYVSKNAPKIAYAEKVKDNQGREYFIACGYYPDADRRQVTTLVQRAYTHMKRVGKSRAAKDFNDKRSKEFRYGDLYIFVFDKKGKVVANGGQPVLVGSNQFDLKDEDGVYYVREMLEKAAKGGGWVDYKDKNLFRTVYVEMVHLGVDDYIIGSGLFPITKQETMELLVKSGSDYLKAHPNKKVFADFIDKEGKFIRGDLNLFVVDSTGIIFAAGDNYDLIWRNFLNTRDDNGKPFIRLMINTVKRGPGYVSYHIRGTTRVTYVQEVKKNGRTFVVGSGYYL